MPKALDRGSPGYFIGLALGVLHLANLPLASLHRVGATVAAGHLMNLPFASRQGAALAEPAIPIKTAAIMRIGIAHRTAA